MKRIISALVLVTAASIGVAACSGDDDDSSNGTAGKSNSGGMPATGDGGTPATGEGGAPATNNGGAPAAMAGSPATNNGGEPSASGGASPGNVMCDPTEDGVCQNPTDCPFVVDGRARMTAGTCGQGCLTSADENCSRDCILDQLDMSSGCAKCYADTVACTILKCLAPCINNPEADACKQCQVDKGCRAAFNECSGLPD